MNINWKTIGREREWPKPCCCEFIGPGLPMRASGCPVHKDLGPYECCGTSASDPCPAHCTEYRPRSRAPVLRLDCMGQLGMVTGWPKCVCGHPAQCHG